MTYQDFGVAVESTHSSVSQWVEGKHTPRPKQLRKIAEVTGVEPEVLFRMVDYLPPEAGQGEVNGKEINPRIRRLMLQAAQLPDDLFELVTRQFELVLEMNRMREENEPPEKEKRRTVADE